MGSTAKVGTSMDMARSALKYALRAVPQGSYVELVKFDDSFVPLFGKFVQFNQETLVAMDAFADALQPNGGTSIAPPLQYITNLASPEGGRMKRVIVLLTCVTQRRALSKHPLQEASPNISFLPPTLRAGMAM